MTTLADLRPGDRALVTGFEGDEVSGRLMEMGIVPGTAIEVVRLAPLGDPMDVRVRGYHLSLRRHEARRVLVEAG